MQVPLFKQHAFLLTHSTQQCALKFTELPCDRSYISLLVRPPVSRISFTLHLKMTQMIE